MKRQLNHQLQRAMNIHKTFSVTMFRFHAKLLVADLKQIGSNHPDFIENLFRQVSVLCLLMEKNN